MLPSILTTFLFSFSVIFAARSAKLLGTHWANLGRIALAMLFLGAWAFIYGQGVRGPGFRWFFVSGMVGFGLGDMALFGALARIGPRLTVLLTQCLTAPIAAAAEWIWLGTVPRPAELVCGGVILAGVGLALAPDHGWSGEKRVFRAGVCFGVGAALGQAFGAVISRKAYDVSSVAQIEIDGGTAAFQRILGGVLVTVAGVAVLRRIAARAGAKQEASNLGRGWPYVVANALSGPTLGVGCYQWALKTAPSAIVLPVVATSPLVTTLLSFIMHGETPRRRAVVGGIVAVAGAIALDWLHARS